MVVFVGGGEAEVEVVFCMDKIKFFSSSNLVSREDLNSLNSPVDTGAKTVVPSSSLAILS